MYLERFLVTGQVAVITGGGRGIGHACAEALGEAGAHLVLIEPDLAIASEGVDQLLAKGFSAEAFQGDVRQAARMTEIADTLAARGRPATILVNNAGVGQNGIEAQDVSDADWLWMMDVNLNGVFWCARAFGRHMLTAGKGSIVNIGSMSGTIANRPQPQTAYNVSKAAVHHLTRSLAGEWADRGVRVNAVAPTYIETPLVTAIAANAPRIPIWLNDTPMGRMGQVDEVASAVLFLASEAASLMTGAIVAVDGGFTVW